MTVNLRRAFAASKPAFARAALLSLYASGVPLFAPRSLKGMGTIFMLHRVREPDDTDFAPNRILEITPAFLEAILYHVHERGMVCVTLDEAVRRIAEGDTSERFVTFTLDDGYRDNFTVAAPIFNRYRIPFTVYLATDLPDGTAELWWVVLERVIAGANEMRVHFPTGDETFVTRTSSDKNAAWNAIYWRLRALGETALRAEVRRLAREHGIDMKGVTRELAMNWGQVRDLVTHPYASVEAHTASHVALAHMSVEEARADIARGLARHKTELGRAPKHFSYPYGDPTSAGERDFDIVSEFGFRSATTTRKGLIHPAHADGLMRLPRLSLNGNFQSLHILDVLMSGVPFALAKAAGTQGID